MSVALKRIQFSLVLAVGCVFSTFVSADGEVRFVETSFAPATPFRYTAEGLTHTWGLGENQIIDSFNTDDDTFRFALKANRVELLHDDIPTVSTGLPCGAFVERVGPNSSALAADFPNDAAGSGNCDMASMLASRVVNRGALDLFSNAGPNPKNVERVDYLFDSGVFAPFTANALTRSGHLVAEKRGNNRIQIAAILAVDVLGQPTEFGPLVRVHEFFASDTDGVRYGETNLRHDYSFFQSNSVTPQAFPVFLEDSTETVAMAFVSSFQLGLSVGQQYFGFSYFGDDVDPSIHTLTAPSTFPNDTADNFIVFGDGADIYGGVSGLFVSDSISVASGAVFLDENGDGMPGANEAGISDINITLFEDVDLNGGIDEDVDVTLGSFPSGMDGTFVLPGLPNGQFLLLVDEEDPNFPAGLQIPMSDNPLVFVVDNDDPDNLNFAFIDQADGDGGSPAVDGSGSGGADAGGSDEVDSDVDGSDASGIDDGGADASDIAPPIDSTDTATGVTTDAVPDTAQVDQGQTVLIDVLANDIDAAGLGLNLVSVESSPNAAVSIQDGMVEFTPNFNFFGQDTFIYMISDANGVEAAATVVVEVIRFSDINNNGINDFVECDCDSLQLETGIHGFGVGGGAVPWSFLLLVGLFGFVRRSARTLRISRKRISWSA